LADVDDDVGTTRELVACGVEVEPQHISHRHDRLRQIAGGGVESEARLRRCVLRAGAARQANRASALRK
jgi:hypothetical protein